MENLKIIENTSITKAFSERTLNRFLAFIDCKQVTTRAYYNNLKQFYKWVQNNSYFDLKRENIIEYKQYLKQKGYTAGTQNQYLRAVKQFFRYLASEGIYPNIADNVKGAKVNNDNTKKEAFDEEDIKTILSSINTNTLYGKRNYLMVLLAVTGGLRIIELQRADIKDLQVIKGNLVLYIQGKGRDEKDEYIKIIPKVADALNDYLRARGHYTKNDALFIDCSNRVNKTSERLAEESISRIFKNIFKRAGYNSEKFTAHSLRHTANTILFKAGADIYTVQKFARHKDPRTTEIYLHTNEKEKSTNEQDILNQIYNPELNIHNELLTKVKSLTRAEQLKVLEFIKSL